MCIAEGLRIKFLVGVHCIYKGCVCTLATAMEESKSGMQKHIHAHRIIPVLLIAVDEVDNARVSVLV